MIHNELDPKSTIHLQYKRGLLFSFSAIRTICSFFFCFDFYLPSPAPFPPQKKIIIIKKKKKTTTDRKRNMASMDWKCVCVNSVTANQCPFRVMVRDVRGVTA